VSRLNQDTEKSEIKDRPLAYKIGASLLVFIVIAAWLLKGDTTKLRPNCLLYPGAGECTFSNESAEVMSGCGHVYVFCGKLYDRGGKKGTRLCSGELQPGESKKMKFEVVEFDELVAPYTNWRDACDHVWEAD